jgi:fatty acid desaturase
MPAHLLTPEKVRSIVTVPTVAIPTVLLAVMCCIGVLIMITGLHLGVISPSMCLVINSIFIFASFTPLHDATHGSIAKSPFRWVNDFIGLLCGFVMCLPYAAFRYLHLQHHQHTNDVEKDPDVYTSFGPWYVLPFRWMTIEYHHYSCYLKVFFNRSISERVLALGQMVMNYGLVWYCIHTGHTTTVLYGWLLPGRVAVFFLALFFDYLPHRPHSHTRKENEYLATSLTALWPSKSSISLLTWPLLHQNYHNIHHLVPYIPFYMYETVWTECKDELEKQGTQTIPIFGAMKKID